MVSGASTHISSAGMVGHEKKLECLSLANLKPFNINLVVEDFLVPVPIFLQQRWLA
jgi:hypothetical protein